MKERGQTAIELSVTFLVVFILLVAAARIFVWFSNNLAKRQEYFAQTRRIHGTEWVEGPPVYTGYGEYGSWEPGPLIEVPRKVHPEDVQTFDNFEPERLRLVE